MSVKVVADDSGWRSLRRRLRRMDRGGAHVRVGVLADAGAHHGGMSLIELAAVHEFGSPSANIPERSFMRAGIREKRDELSRLLAANARGVVLGKLSVDQALSRTGLWGAATVRRKIMSGNVTPPLKPETIARKGSSVPLLDTGQLANAISWEIVG